MWAKEGRRRDSRQGVAMHLEQRSLDKREPYAVGAGEWVGDGHGERCLCWTLSVLEFWIQILVPRSSPQCTTSQALSTC